MYITRKYTAQIGELNTEELSYLRDLVIAQLKNSTVLNAALMSYMMEPKYTDNIQ